LLLPFVAKVLYALLGYFMKTGKPLTTVCFAQQINQLFKADSKAVKLNLVSVASLNAMYRLIHDKVLLAYDGAGLQNYYSVDLLRKLDLAVLTVFSNHVRGVIVIPNNVMAMANAKPLCNIAFRSMTEDKTAIWKETMPRQPIADEIRCHEL
jgi:hypothetical protein